MHNAHRNLTASILTIVSVNVARFEYIQHAWSLQIKLQTDSEKGIEYDWTRGEQPDPVTSINEKLCTVTVLQHLIEFY